MGSDRGPYLGFGLLKCLQWRHFTRVVRAGKGIGLALLPHIMFFWTNQRGISKFLW